MQKSDPLTILIIMDSVRADVLYNSIQAHRMPYLEKYIFSRAAVVENCFTCFPTNTVPGHLAILTGCYADKHHLPHMKFWNLSQMKYRDYSGLDIFNLLDDEYNSNIKMIYEFFTNSYAFTLANFAKGSNYAYLNKARMIFFYLMQKILGYKIILMQSLKTFLRYLKQNLKGSLFVLWLPVSDEIGHAKGPTSPEFLQHLQEIDRIFFKALFEGYKGWDGLIKTGLQDSTYFFITADHGGFPIQTESELIQDLKILPLKIKNKQVPLKTVNNYDALIAYTDGVANFYVKNPVSQNWADKIEYTRLVKYPTPQGSINLIEQLLTIPTISHVFARESFVGAESYLVQSQSGKGRIQRKIEDHKILLAYQVLSGADPFEYKNPQILELMDGNFYSTEEWLNKLVGTNYPMMLDQIPRVFHCANIGDLLIMGKEGYSFAKKSKKGTHDTGTHICSRVPLIMVGPSIKHTKISTARTVDILPTILHLLKIDAEFQQFDGRVLSEILETPL
jgi:predicted AlkP superfamily pyrophosphatase or phosphodiesterase